MNLTTQQLAALKADIIADGTLSQQPNNSTGNQVIADAYNLPAAPAFFVYRTAIPMSEVFDQIDWANFTPQDVPDTTQAWANRSLACQGKQFNLQTMLAGRSSIDATRAKVRAGLQDALTALPSGASGATRSAGWVSLRDNTLARSATRIEKLLANVAGGNGSTAQLAAVPVVEGVIGYTDIETARSG